MLKSRNCLHVVVHFVYFFWAADVPVGSVLFEFPAVGRWAGLNFVLRSFLHPGGFCLQSRYLI